jgi:hypothetical protein
MKTLNHDEEFEDDESGVQYEPHSIVYGEKGWTDDLSEETIALLVSKGIIVPFMTYTGRKHETRIYVSVQGIGP